MWTSRQPDKQYLPSVTVPNALRATKAQEAVAAPSAQHLTAVERIGLAAAAVRNEDDQDLGLQMEQASQESCEVFPDQFIFSFLNAVGIA